MIHLDNKVVEDVKQKNLKKSTAKEHENIKEVIEEETLKEEEEKTLKEEEEEIEKEINIQNKNNTIF